MKWYLLILLAICAVVMPRCDKAFGMDYDMVPACYAMEPAPAIDYGWQFDSDTLFSVSETVPVFLAATQCENGSCAVLTSPGLVRGQPVRNLIRSGPIRGILRARPVRSFFARRPVRSFLGRLFGR